MARQIFVFTAGTDAKEHLRDSIVSPIPLDKALAGAGERAVIEKVNDFVGALYAWGATPGPMNDRTYARMQVGDWVLTCYDSVRPAHAAQRADHG